MMSQQNSNGSGNGQGHHESGPLFNVHNVYLKDISFEAPYSPQVFNEAWKPKIDFDLKMGSQLLSEAESVYEVVLDVTVTVKLGENEAEKVAFLIEVQQAGAFTVRNLVDEALQQVLSTTCATVLFPYVRETVSSLAARGGFPHLVLPPINFEAMYAHHVATKDKEEVKEGTQVI
jgi:preprotein translocase subunit SecB